MDVKLHKMNDVSRVDTKSRKLLQYRRSSEKLGCLRTYVRPHLQYLDDLRNYENCSPRGTVGTLPHELYVGTGSNTSKRPSKRNGMLSHQSGTYVIEKDTQIHHCTGEMT